MAVEEVYVPPKTSTSDPKKAVPSPGTDPIYWRGKADEAKARLDYVEAQKTIERISDPEPPQEPPFKIKGEVNLGTIDFQQQAREAQEKADRIVEEQRKETERLRQRNEELQSDKTKLEIQSLQNVFDSKFEVLRRDIQTNNVKPKSFLEQYEELTELNKRITTLVPSTGLNTQNPLQLEVLRLQADMAREERNFRREMRNDEKKWNMDMARLQEERAGRLEQLQVEKDKNAMWGNSFKMLGAAIASGIMDNAAASELETGIAARPPEPRPQPATGKAIRVEADPGEAGEFPCPNCKQMIAVGPTTTQAKCIACGTTAFITRKEETPA